jgi:tRNA-splicing ligase RtcB
MFSNVCKDSTIMITLKNTLPSKGDGQGASPSPKIAKLAFNISPRPEGLRGIHASPQDGAGLVATIFPPVGDMPEREAIEQLLRFGRVRSLDGKSALYLAGMSDLHPNHPIPVGAALATPEDFVVPSAIGSDINCGMRMVRFDLPKELDDVDFALVRAALREPLVEARRDIPLTGAHYKALFNGGPLEMAAMELPSAGLWRAMDKQSFKQAADVSAALGSMHGSSARMPDFLLQDRLMRDPGLGTLGSGNHFFEFQRVDERIDKQAAHRLGITSSRSALYGLIHTGSRDVGQSVGSRHATWARQAWLDARQSAPEGIFTLQGAEAKAYLAAQWAAARYAWLNRMVLQEMARQALSKALGSEVGAHAIADCSHNVALIENGMVIHRKGACRACAGDTCLIPGSMGDYSFVATGLGLPEALSSCSHGAGRSRRRGAASRAKGESKLPFIIETQHGRRASEEAPWNYMDVERGVEAQQEAGLIELCARMAPIATFKA